MLSVQIGAGHEAGGYLLCKNQTFVLVPIAQYSNAVLFVSSVIVHFIVGKGLVPLENTFSKRSIYIIYTNGIK